MIASGYERVREAGEHAPAVVMNLGHLAVKQARRPHDAPAEPLADGLMAEADPEERESSREPLDDLGRQAGLGGATGPRGDDDCFRIEGLDLLQRKAVVAADEDLCAQLAEVLKKV